MSGDGESAVDADVLLARAYLSRVAEPACLPVWALVREAGPVAAAAAIRAGSVAAEVRSATEARSAACEPEAELESAERHEIRLVVPESDEWPHFAFGALERTADRRLAERTAGAPGDESGEPVPPLALWVRGTADLASLGARSVGIVGARSSTPYGERVAADLAYGVSGAGVVVVSGGAYGIDAAAHRGALAGGGQTVIVSAGGIDRPYPAGNRGLFDRAAAHGLVLSESPPGTAPQRHRFLTRNRLIAALSAGTVIVEAGRRSGAANTAAHCFALGRPVLAVPGPVTSAMSVGCHALLRRQPAPAVLVADVRDVLAELGFLTDVEPDTGQHDDGPLAIRRAAIDGLDPVARRVYDGLSRRSAASPHEISLRSGVTVVDVLRALPALELAGLLETVDGAYRAAP